MLKGQVNNQPQFDFESVSFFNTNKESGPVLEKSHSDAKSQEDVIYELYLGKKLNMAWFEVKSFLPDFNECSIKRSITNLKNKGKLIKTTDLVMGIHGKSNHKYKLA